MSISPAQCRGARGLINWSQGRLSEEAKVARATIAEFEGGKRMPIGNNLLAIKSALEAAGVVFLDTGDVAKGPGVALKGDE